LSNSDNPSIVKSTLHRGLDNFLEIVKLFNPKKFTWDEQQYFKALKLESAAQVLDIRQVKDYMEVLIGVMPDGNHKNEIGMVTAQPAMMRNRIEQGYYSSAYFLKLKPKFDSWKLALKNRGAKKLDPLKLMAKGLDLLKDQNQDGTE
jgi:hypothetical protein